MMNSPSVSDTLGLAKFSFILWALYDLCADSALLCDLRDRSTLTKSASLFSIDSLACSCWGVNANCSMAQVLDSSPAGHAETCKYWMLQELTAGRMSTPAYLLQLWVPTATDKRTWGYLHPVCQGFSSCAARAAWSEGTQCGVQAEQHPGV